MEVICEHRNICGWEKRKNQWKCYHAELHEKYNFCDNTERKGFGREMHDVKVDCTTAKCIPIFIDIVKGIINNEL